MSCQLYLAVCEDKRLVQLPDIVELSRDWKYFDNLLSGNWRNEDTITLPFSSSVVRQFTSMIYAEYKVNYDDVSVIIEYLGPKTDSWLTNVSLVGQSLDLYKRLGKLLSDNSEKRAACLSIEQAESNCQIRSLYAYKNNFVMLGVYTQAFSSELEKFDELLRVSRELGDTRNMPLFEVLHPNRSKIASIRVARWIILQYGSRKAWQEGYSYHNYVAHCAMAVEKYIHNTEGSCSCSDSD